MQYTMQYESPLGKILMASDGTGITGLWFYAQARFAASLDPEHAKREMPVFDLAKHWLDEYFSGKEPGFTVPVHLTGTDFQIHVWGILCTIPYGKTKSYVAVAQKLAEEKGMRHMSAQAVGGAAARNPVSILIPCHRVIKADGELGGYAGEEIEKLPYCDWNSRIDKKRPYRADDRWGNGRVKRNWSFDERQNQFTEVRKMPLSVYPKRDVFRGRFHPACGGQNQPLFALEKPEGPETCRD